MEQNTNKKRGCPRTRNSELGASGVVLGREAERLLVALGPSGAYAFPDPSSPDEVILRGAGAGISLGGGRFASQSGEALVAAGLVEREEGRRTHLVIAKAGQARLRRIAAGGDTAYLAQHLDLVTESGKDAPPLRDASESPLAWMARRRGRDGAPLIDGACFEAGERLRRDLSLAALLPSMTADWSQPRVDGSGPRDAASGSDAMMAARQRVEHALKAAGSDLSGLLIDLCGFLKGLERIELERGWPPRSAKIVIRLALGRLAEHYGLERQAVGPDRARLRLWRAVEQPAGAPS